MSRTGIPRLVRHSVAAESGGRCLNPECQTPLFEERKPIGEIAHIEPHSTGGGVTADNLLFLCGNCHKSHEPRNRPEEKKKLRQWKRDRQEEIAQQFKLKFKTFDDLAKHVMPLLKENHQIFKDYGPQTDDREAYKLWQLFELKLVVNNAKLKLLLNDENLRLFHQDNRKAIEGFIAHVNEFAMTREEFNGIRKKLFPKRILSIFKIEKEIADPIAFVNPVQNYIGILQKRGCDVKLEFRPELLMRISDNDEEEILELGDRPRLDQLLFSERAYRPCRTELRLDTLQIILDRIERAGAKWAFDDLSDLTIITLNGSTRVKLFYSYALSLANLHSVDVQEIKYVANLYRWNDAPSCEDAIEYARKKGLKILRDNEDNEFIEFCRRLPKLQ